jgi:hypothetical protein
MDRWVDLWTGKGAGKWACKRVVCGRDISNRAKEKETVIATF